MTDIAEIVRTVRIELSPAFEERLRALLEHQDREWLIDQIVRLTLDQHSLQEIDRKAEREAKATARRERLERVRGLAIDEATLAGFIETHRGIDRAALLSDGRLVAGAPEKGTALLGPEHRSDRGEELLQRAKDILFALLFGDESTGTHLQRTQQELLTFALPTSKARALDFMRASTELSASGTWQDPESVSNDERADNVLLEVQYGDTADERVGDGIIVALSLINSLEVNEQVLYARMIDVEQTTLIT
ncbi:MAG TPA: hypothetical protein VF479_05620 [Pseudolysinimonas sp.]